MAGLLLFPHRTLRTRSLPLRPHLPDQRLAPARRLSQGPRQPRSRALPDCPPIPRSRCHPRCHRNPPPRSLFSLLDQTARRAQLLDRPRRQVDRRPRRDELADDHVLLQAEQVVGLARDRRLCEDAAAMQAYLASDLDKGIVGNPNFANLTSRDFEVLSGPTTSSGGPVAASLTAIASLAS